MLELIAIAAVSFAWMMFGIQTVKLIAAIAARRAQLRRK